MGWVTERPGPGGKTRYTGVYRDIEGRKRSAGTYDSKKQAIAGWVMAEAELAAGRVGDPRRGRQTLRDYIERDWFPNHVIEASTREGYRYMLNRHILPNLGGVPIGSILPIHIREFVLKLQRQNLGPPSISKVKTVLDAIFTTALNDQVIAIHPTRGVKTPPVERKPKRILTSTHYQRIYDALPTDEMRLLVETDIESGLRWGELTELRISDLDLETHMLTVSRAVVELRAKDRPQPERFVVKPYPKSKHYRRVQLAPHMVAKLAAHFAKTGLGPHDLIFKMPSADGPTRRTRPETLPHPDDLGWTQPTASGRSYRHGTTTAYAAGKCRCRYCRDAIAAYRAERRAMGKDEPRRGRSVQTDGHIPNSWFRSAVWDPAVEAAEIGFVVTPHDMRHAHASWLLAGGADLQTVKERLGHGSISTTSRYLHALPGAQQAALAALDVIRRTNPAAKEQDSTEMTSASELADLRSMVADLTQMVASLVPRVESHQDSTR